MRFNSRTRTTHTLTLDDDSEVELEHEPYDEDDIFVEQKGDKLVVCYLVEDGDGGHCNPLKDYDCQGKFYTNPTGYGRDSIITDDAAEFRCALALDSYGDPDLERVFDCVPYRNRYEEVRRVTLWGMAVDQLMLELVNGANEDLKEAWCRREYGELVEGQDYEVDADAVEDAICHEGFYADEVAERARKLYAEHWWHVTGRCVLPVYYHSERGTTQIYVAQFWSGDLDDLPRGVWIADKNVLDNLVVMAEGLEANQIKQPDGTFMPMYELTLNGQQITTGTLGHCWEFAKANYPTTEKDRFWALVKYAESVLSEYASWCDGDIYGCVMEEFERQADGSWSSEEVESCWGYIGFEWAKQALKAEFIDPAIERLAKEVA